MAYLNLGERKPFLSSLEKAVAERDQMLVFFFSIYAEAIGDDPRVAELERQFFDPKLS